MDVNFGVIDAVLKARPNSGQPYPEGSYRMLDMVKPNTMVRIKNVGAAEFYVATELADSCEYPVGPGETFELNVPSGTPSGCLYLVGPLRTSDVGRAKIFFMGNGKSK